MRELAGPIGRKAECIVRRLLMNRILRKAEATAAIAISIFVSFFTTVAMTGSMSQTENFFDRPGCDYHHYQSVGGVSQCSSSCATNAQCLAFTYVVSTGTCWMKNSVPAWVANNCCHSGVKV